MVFMDCVLYWFVVFLTSCSDKKFNVSRGRPAKQKFQKMASHKFLISDQAVNDTARALAVNLNLYQ